MNVFTLADKMQDLPPRQDTPLFALRSGIARDLYSIEEKDASVERAKKDLENAQRVVQETVEYGELEATKEELKRLRDEACDTAPIRDAKAAVKKARAALKVTAVYRHAVEKKQEAVELTDAQIEARRAAIRRLFGARKVIEVDAVAPAIDEGSRPS